MALEPLIMKKKPQTVRGTTSALLTGDAQKVAKWHPPQNAGAVATKSRPFFRNTRMLTLMPIQTLKQTITRSFGYSMQEHEWEHFFEYLGATVIGLKWNGSVFVPSTLRQFVDRYFQQVA